MNDLTVLCVENRPEHRGASKFMLETAGYEVIPASNADQALHLFTTRRVDGVLLEYDLPDATGAAVRAELNRIKPEVPVLLFAGVGSQTPSLLRFFDSYLRNSAMREFVLQDRNAQAEFRENADEFAACSRYTLGVRNCNFWYL
jgi:response regulator RpfG family c-di-GMP phosphodiesterase